MDASRAIIRGFLDSEEIVYSIDPDGAFRFMTELSRACRIRSCATLLKCEESRLLVTFELPLRVPRRECESVEWRIASINARLHEYECFETDLLDGMVRFRLTADLPESIRSAYVEEIYTQLYAMMEYCLDVVEKYVNEIAEMIFVEFRPYRRETVSPRIAKLQDDDVYVDDPYIEDPYVDDLYDDDDMYESEDIDDIDIDKILSTGKPKKDSPFIRMLKFVGLVENID